MLVLAIFALIVMGLCNYLLCRKILYPPVIFCWVWAIDILIVLLAGDSFYAISAPTLAVVLCGAVAFSIGSIIAFAFTDSTPIPAQQPTRRAVNILAIFIGLAVPLYLHSLMQLRSQYGEGAFLSVVHAALVHDADSIQTNLGDTLLAYAVQWSIFFAFIAFYDKGVSRKMFIFAFSASLFLNILTGGRTGAATLLIGLIGLHLLKRGRWKPVALIIAAAVILFGVTSIYLQYGSVRKDASLSENLAPLTEQFIVYSAGGLVGLDRVIKSPKSIEHNWQIDDFFVRTAARFNHSIESPNIHADYSDLGPYKLSNVYTLYFAYMDLTWPGAFIVVLLLGSFCTWVYVRAVSGHAVASILYAALFVGIILSPYAERFFMNMDFLLRLTVVSWVVYRLKPELLPSYRIIENS